MKTRKLKFSRNGRILFLVWDYSIETACEAEYWDKEIARFDLILDSLLVATATALSVVTTIMLTYIWR